MATYTTDQIIAIGGSEWQRGDKHRVYINDWTALIGLDIDRYKSGGISSATLDGQVISNSEAGRLIGAIYKIYLDAADGVMHIQWSTYGHMPRTMTREEMAERIFAAIRQAVASLGDDDTDGGTPASGIVQALRSAGRSAREIAEMVGVSASTIYRWARGLCQPCPANAAALALLVA